MQRKPHRKSTAGCVPCKQRHIKCDETGPPCANCAIRLSSCRYPIGRRALKRPAAPSHRGSADTGSRPPAAATAAAAQQRPTLMSAPAPSLTSAGAAFSSDRGLELELMHRWTTRTWRGMEMFPGCAAYLRHQLPREALRYDFILSTVLAMAALDLATTGGRAGRRRYGRAALEYCIDASARFRAATGDGGGLQNPALSRVVTQDNIHVFTQFGNMAGYFNFVKPPTGGDDAAGAAGAPGGVTTSTTTTATPTISRVHQSMSMFVGSAQTAALNFTWFLDSPTSARQANEHYGRGPRPELFALLDPATVEALNRLSRVLRAVPDPGAGSGSGSGGGSQDLIALPATATTATATTKTKTCHDRLSYRVAVGHLKYLFAEQALGDVKGAFVSLPSVAEFGGPGEFLGAVRRREPMAVLILAYLGVLVCRSAASDAGASLWWIGPTGRELVAESSWLLARSSAVWPLEDVREAVSWCRREARLEPLPA